MKTTAIIGGGITGLAVAYHLQQHGRGEVHYVLSESAPRYGGKITSVRESGFTIEGGPDSFLAQKPAALQLCRALGLSEQLIPTNPVHRVFVWSRKRLRLLPEGGLHMSPLSLSKITALAHSDLISWPGKLRMGMELFIPPRRSAADESLADFVRRRFGKEALDKIAGPVMASIYAADPAKLSLRSSFPRFQEMEERHGSVLRAALAERRPAAAENGSERSLMFLSLREGLQQLITALQASLPPERLMLSQRVVTVTRRETRWELFLADGTRLAADDVVFATPAYVTAELLAGIDLDLASKLRRIRYVSTATVSLGFRRSDVPHPLDGFGFMMPQSEGHNFNACTWSSSKFPFRAPEDCVLMRVFVGGARAESLAEQDESALEELAREELRLTMRITANPLLSRVFRWHKAIPQYEVGHQDRVVDIEQCVASHPGLHVAGAAYHGAGIPNCVQNAQDVAEQILNRAGMSLDRG